MFQVIAILFLNATHRRSSRHRVNQSSVAIIFQIGIRIDIPYPLYREVSNI